MMKQKFVLQTSILDLFSIVFYRQVSIIVSCPFPRYHYPVWCYLSSKSRVHFVEDTVIIDYLNFNCLQYKRVLSYIHFMLPMLWFIKKVCRFNINGKSSNQKEKSMIATDKITGHGHTNIPTHSAVKELTDSKNGVNEFQTSTCIDDRGLLLHRKSCMKTTSHSIQ